MHEKKKRSALISAKKISIWCLCGFGKHLQVKIVQQKNSIFLANDINVLYCQSNQLCLGFWKYPFRFWLNQELKNTICSVIPTVVFLSHVRFLYQARVSEARAKLAVSPLHSLHWGAGALSVEGQLQPSRNSCVFSPTVFKHSPHAQASPCTASFTRCSFVHCKAPFPQNACSWKSFWTRL